MIGEVGSGHPKCATGSWGTQGGLANLGRQVKTTFDDGSFVRSEFDQYGRVVNEFDQLNQRKASTYDRHGRLTSVELPGVADPQNGGAVTRPKYEYRYDARGNLIGIRDPLFAQNAARQTTFTFDERGNQLTRTLTNCSQFQRTVHSAGTFPGDLPACSR